MSERLSAMRKLKDNPHDVQAMGSMYQAQKKVNVHVHVAAVILDNHTLYTRCSLFLYSDGQLGIVEAAARSVDREHWTQLQCCRSKSPQTRFSGLVQKGKKRFCFIDEK